MIPRLAIVFVLVFACLQSRAATPATEPESKIPLAAGTIDTIDLGRRLIILTLTNGPATFAINDRTLVFDRKEKISVDQLKRGDRIKLRFIPTDDPIPTVRIIKLALPDAAPPVP